jgi:hypothetical protein
VILSWERPRGATRFRIFRSDFTLSREFRNADVGSEVWIPGPFREIGLTDQFYFVDTTVTPGGQYHYYVATDGGGRTSQPSNLVRVPNLAPPATFRNLDSFLAQHTNRGRGEAQGVTVELLGKTQALLQSGDLDEALRQLELLRRNPADDPLVKSKPWLAEDLEIMLGKLARRMALVQAGLLSSEDLK